MTQKNQQPTGFRHQTAGEGSSRQQASPTSQVSLQKQPPNNRFAAISDKRNSSTWAENAQQSGKWPGMIVRKTQGNEKENKRTRGKKIVSITAGRARQVSATEQQLLIQHSPGLASSGQKLSTLQIPKYVYDGHTGLK